MAGDSTASPLKHEALAAFQRGDDDCAKLLQIALVEHPSDGTLIIASAAALLRSGAPDPLLRLEAMLSQAPDWVEGHKALCRLKSEAMADDPLGSIERALEKLPKHPGLWMGYLTLLGSMKRHDDAASHAASLRKTIADLPELRLVEARHLGFAGKAKEAQMLLDGLPGHLPEIGFERARNFLRIAEYRRATEEIERVLAENPHDIGAWALAELCWRVTEDQRHEWLCPADAMFKQCDLGLSNSELEELSNTLCAIHTTRGAPLGQSVERGTQTHGNLRLRSEPSIKHLFQRIEAALCDYTSRFESLSGDHPLSALRARLPEITASWSILLEKGGRHVPHLHDGGLISSAAHIRVPSGLKNGEGALELGRPPEDIPLDLAPLARFEAKPGHLVLFPSFVYHSTSPFTGGTRLTAAFDAV